MPLSLPVSFPKWGAGPSIMSWTLNYELAFSTTAAAAAPGVLSQPGPSILGRAPQFWESAGAPKKWPIWGGKNYFWTPQKKFHRGNGCDMCFLQKNWTKSVKFGLGGRSNISLPHIGGSHPVPSLSLQPTERRGTAMYYVGRGRKSHVLWRHCHPESFCAPGKFLCITMKSTIKRHAKMQRFPDGIETIQMAWKLSRWPGNFPDGLETFQMARKLSKWPGNFPDGLETFQMAWKLSRCSGNFPDGLETFQMV